MRWITIHPIQGHRFLWVIQFNQTMKYSTAAFTLIFLFTITIHSYKHLLIITAALFVCLTVSNNANGQAQFEDYSEEDKTIIFHDDFDNNQNDWWKGSKKTKTSIKNGFFNLDRTHNKDDKGRGHPTQTINELNIYNDFEIETRFRLVKGSTRLSSLLFNFKDGDNNYKFGISSDNDYRIVEMTDNEWNSRKGWTKSVLVNNAGGNFNKFTIRKVGSELFYFLNEELVHREEFTESFSKKMGFEVNRKSHLQIDYLTVSHLKQLDHQKVLYSDFKQHNQQEILIDHFDSDSGTWTKEIDTGRFWVENGYYYIESVKDDRANINIPTKLDTSKSFEIETQLQFLSGDDRKSLDLIWGYKDDDNFYEFSTSGNSYYRIAEFREGRFYIHKRWTKTNIVKQGGLNKLTVRNVGDQNYFFINEELVYQEFAEPGHGTGVGFSVYNNSKIRADYISISQLETSLKQNIAYWVERKINTWQEKSKYETTEAYQERVTEEKRNELIKHYTAELVDSLGQAQFETDIANTDYDADNQIFEVTFTDESSVYVEVPVNEAPEFDQNLNRLRFSNMDFAITSGDELILRKAQIYNPGNEKTYAYDSGHEVAFNTAEMAANFDLIEVDVETESRGPSVQKTTKRIEVGKADVDVNIPETSASNPDAIAVVIGNRRYQGDTPDVDYAVNDAKIVKEYLVKTLGFKEGNILYKENASLSNLRALFGDERNEGRLADYIKPDQSDVFVYYSGHGAPDTDTNNGYIVPVDGDASALAVTGYSMETLYNNLGNLPARSIQVVIDACFSGGSSNGEMLIRQASPIGIEVKNPAIQLKNGLVITASQGDQISSWYEEKGHGLLTYFYLKGLQGQADANGDHLITGNEMAEYLTDRTETVPYMARLLFSREQTPQVFGRKQQVIVEHE